MPYKKNKKRNKKLALSSGKQTNDDEYGNKGC